MEVALGFSDDTLELIRYGVINLFGSVDTAAKLNLDDRILREKLSSCGVISEISSITRWLSGNLPSRRPIQQHSSEVLCCYRFFLDPELHLDDCQGRLFGHLLQR